MKLEEIRNGQRYAVKAWKNNDAACVKVLDRDAGPPEKRGEMPKVRVVVEQGYFRGRPKQLAPGEQGIINTRYFLDTWGKYRKNTSTKRRANEEHEAELNARKLRQAQLQGALEAIGAPNARLRVGGVGAYVIEGDTLEWLLRRSGWDPERGKNVVADINQRRDDKRRADQAGQRSA
jgi:hypothetical protein